MKVNIFVTICIGLFLCSTCNSMLHTSNHHAQKTFLKRGVVVSRKLLEENADGQENTRVEETVSPEDKTEESTTVEVREESQVTDQNESPKIEEVTQEDKKNEADNETTGSAVATSEDAKWEPSTTTTQQEEGKQTDPSGASEVERKLEKSEEKQGSEENNVKETWKQEDSNQVWQEDSQAGQETTAAADSDQSKSSETWRDTSENGNKAEETQENVVKPENKDEHVDWQKTEPEEKKEEAKDSEHQNDNAQTDGKINEVVQAEAKAESSTDSNEAQTDTKGTEETPVEKVYVEEKKDSEDVKISEETPAEKTDVEEKKEETEKSEDVSVVAVEDTQTNIDAGTSNLKREESDASEQASPVVEEAKTDDSGTTKTIDNVEWKNQVSDNATEKSDESVKLEENMAEAGAVQEKQANEDESGNSNPQVEDTEVHNDQQQASPVEEDTKMVDSGVSKSDENTEQKDEVNDNESAESKENIAEGGDTQDMDIPMEVQTDTNQIGSQLEEINQNNVFDPTVDQRASNDPLDDEYDIMQQLADLPSKFHETAGKVADHIRPDVEKWTNTSREYFNIANQHITESFSPLVGHQYAPLLASVISYAILLIPLIVVLKLFEHMRALLSLQKVLLFANIYLTAYFVTLWLASYIIRLEPMSFFYQNSLSSYLSLLLLQALGYVIYLALQTANIVNSCIFDRPSVTMTAALQWLVAVSVGLHYYVTVLHPAVKSKPPHTSWKVYAIYSVLFLILCLFARIRWMKKQYVGSGSGAINKKH